MSICYQAKGDECLQWGSSKAGRKRNWSFSICLFILMALLAISAGYYKNAVARERVYFKVNLQQELSQPVVVDIAEQGWPKYIVQPGRISLSSGAAGIRNTGKEALELRIQPAGFPGSLEIKSYTHSLVTDGNAYLVHLAAGEKLSLTLDLEIPREMVYQSQIGTGTVSFVDQASGQALSQVVFTLCNSGLEK